MWSGSAFDPYRTFQDSARFMQISEFQMDRQSLEQFAQEAASLLQNGNFAVLAERFGYALAYGREPALAIEADLSNRLLEMGFADRQAGYIDIKYFNVEATKSTGLAAAIDCLTFLAGDSKVQFSLVVTAKGVDRYITLESVDRLPSQ